MKNLFPVLSWKSLIPKHNEEAMRQEVNLYQAGIRPQKSHLSPLRVLLFLVAFTCLLAGVSLYTQHRATELNRELGKIQARKQTLSKQVDELREKVSQQADRDLRQRIRELEAKKRARRQLVDVISQTGASRQQGFAPYLKALARQHLPELWLTEFRIDLKAQPSLRLSGRTTDSQRIPDYLLRLSQEEIFSGFTFKTLRAERLEKQPDIVGFTLASEGK